VKLAVETLEKRISAAMAKATGQKDCVALVRPATDPKFGDYQVNGVMPLAKSLRKNPRQLAEEVLKNVDLSDVCEQPEIAGPGFINLKLKPDFLAGSLLQINADPQNRLGVDKTENPQTVVVDFSCPNIAKQMHVGHLRSTIIGDCICRTLEFLGHNVIRQNHIGDWGTPMGMVICAAVHSVGGIDYLIEQEGHVSSDIVRSRFANLDDLERQYKEMSALVEKEASAANEVREITLSLQRGERFATELWNLARKITLETCYDLYACLNVGLNEKHTRGESFYKDKLKGVVEELLKGNLAKKSDEAVCVFPPGFKNKEGDPLPFIIQKSDGAYLYATTDLAAIRYRVNKLKADKIVYVTDSRQKLHFEMLFAVGRLAGWAPEELDLVHVMFGSVQGQNGKPLKTREGENVKLKDLLDEAVQRAKAVVEEKNPDLSADEKDEIAKAVGIGAVKYADYSNNRTSDYIFSFDKMLAMDGNTAPYMQYAYARIKSIERKAQSRDVDIETELAGIKSLNLTEPAELELAKHLIRYGEAIQSAADDYRPNYLTAYLYELAQKFSSFYTDCPVLKASPDKRPTRLLLCDLTRKTIKQGLSELLGIEVVEQM
jgi:arginyl-tRNA synthetase